MQISVFTPAFILTATLLVVNSAAAAIPVDMNDIGWLKTMAYAAHRINYTGTFVYQYDDHVETSRITHVLDRDGEHGRLEGLDGIRREIIQHNEKVWRYLGDREVIIGNQQNYQSFPALLPDQLSLLNENYQIRKAEMARVAGFQAQAFVLQPRDNSRYHHKMWAHSDSGLLLKSAVLDDRGRVIEQYAFTQLSIGGNIDRTWIVPDKSAGKFHAHHPIPAKSDSKFHSQHPYATPATKVEEIAAVASSDWQVDFIPSGFKKTMEVRRPLSENKAPVTQMVFSDGLAGISVFIEDEADNPGASDGLSSQGAIQIYRKLNRNHLVTVVGEVPPRTVIQVAESVRYRAQ